MMTLHNDFKEFLNLLNANRVRYLVVGAHALGIYGIPRTTQDFDVFISNDSSNVKRLLKALDEFGFAGMHTAEDFETFGVQLGVAPVRIDLLTDIDGVTFDEAEASGENRVLDGVDIRVIGREALIKNKRAAGRPKDIADVYTLENMRPQ